MELMCYSIHQNQLGSFLVELASCAIRNNASNTEVATKFGYVGLAQILQWKEIYSKLVPNGLLSIQKGRKPKMSKKKKCKTDQVSLNEEENRIAQLEDQVFQLQIENEALKLLASIQQQTENSQK